MFVPGRCGACRADGRAGLGLGAPAPPGPVPSLPRPHPLPRPSARGARVLRHGAAVRRRGRVAVARGRGERAHAQTKAGSTRAVRGPAPILRAAALRHNGVKTWLSATRAPGGADRTAATGCAHPASNAAP